MDDFELTTDADSSTTVTMTKWRFRDELARARSGNTVAESDTGDTVGWSVATRCRQRDLLIAWLTLMAQACVADFDANAWDRRDRLSGLDPGADHRPPIAGPPGAASSSLGAEDPAPPDTAALITVRQICSA
jgi:hypothetical protein